MADNNTIYLEADEDITSAIDKLIKASGTQVQVVAAKRSTLIQSKTNLRLLKKSADDAGKKLVLITSDHLATNLASRIGLPVASQVGETPNIPAAPAPAKLDDDIVDEADLPLTPEPVTPLSTPAAPEPTPSIEPARPPMLTTPPKAATASPKGSKVPNFGTMQKRVAWVIGVIVVIGLLFGLNYYLTSAKLTLYAKANQINASFDFSADPGGSSGATTLPATQLTLQKSLTANVQATGTQDAGTKASGAMTVSNCYDNSPHTLVAGTRFESPSGLLFVSTSDVTVPGGTGSFFGCSTPGTATVQVQAVQNGDGYNLASGTKYTIPGLSTAQQSGIVGQGAQMQGGTTKTLQVIQQADVDKAQQAALAAAKSDAVTELASKASSSQTAIAASFQQTVASAVSNPDVGATSPQATLTIQVTYSELAVDKQKLAALTQSQEQQQVGDGNQIYDDGSGSLKITAASTSSPADAAQSFHAVTVAYAGAKIDKTTLATSLKGKKYGEAADLAAQQPGIDHADLSISPSWATSMPGVASHIHITIKVANIGG